MQSIKIWIKTYLTLLQLGHRDRMYTLRVLAQEILGKTQTPPPRPILPNLQGFGFLSLASYLVYMIHSPKLEGVWRRPLKSLLGSQSPVLYREGHPSRTCLHCLQFSKVSYMFLQPMMVQKKLRMSGKQVRANS